MSIFYIVQQLKTSDPGNRTKENKKKNYIHIAPSYWQFTY